MHIYSVLHYATLSPLYIVQDYYLRISFFVYHHHPYQVDWGNVPNPHDRHVDGTKNDTNRNDEQQPNEASFEQDDCEDNEGGGEEENNDPAHQPATKTQLAKAGAWITAGTVLFSALGL